MSLLTSSIVRTRTIATLVVSQRVPPSSPHFLKVLFNSVSRFNLLPPTSTRCKHSLHSLHTNKRCFHTDHLEKRSERRAVDIKLKKQERMLWVTFDNGEKMKYSAEFLRVESPSAEVQGHTPSQKKVVAGRKHVGIIDLEPVGHYAIRIVFDDLHESGIYSWSYLYKLGKNKFALMKEYLRNLKAHGKSRDPRKNRAAVNADK